MIVAGYPFGVTTARRRAFNTIRNLVSDSEFQNDAVATVNTSNTVHTTETVPDLGDVNTVVWTQGDTADIVGVNDARSLDVIPGQPVNLSLYLLANVTDFAKATVQVTVGGTIYYLRDDGYWVTTGNEVFFEYSTLNTWARWSLATQPVPMGPSAVLEITPIYRNKANFVAHVTGLQVTRGSPLYDYISTSGATTPPPPPTNYTQTQTYTIDSTTDFSNPERGWYTETPTSFTAPVYNHEPAASYAPEARLGFRYVRLDAYTNSAIDSTFLSDLAAEFASWRNTDVKAVLRFAYNRSYGAADAPLSWVLYHIDQLAPLLQEYSDVIYILQAGFAAYWGEWGYTSSTNDLVLGPNNTGDNRRQIKDALIAAIPADMFVAFRRPNFVGPADITNSYNFGDWHTRHATIDDFGTTGQYGQLALHDDGIVVDAANGSWWDSYDGTTTTQDHLIASGITLITPTGGETDRIGPGTDGLNSYNDGANSVAVLEEMHADYLNADFYDLILQKWQTQGYFQEISRRLGYRYELVSAQAPSVVSAGATMNLQLTMNNVGFGAIYHKRPLKVVFIPSGGGATLTATALADARFDLPMGGDSGTVIGLSFTAPAGLVDGQSYALAVMLPDNSPYLENRVGHKIRFANTGLWDATNGWNRLNMNVTVGTSAPPTGLTLIGVGSSSTSLVDYPKTPAGTDGDWFVDPVNGNDSNAGTTVGAAFKTLTKALSVVSDGQRIRVRAGTLYPTARWLRTTQWATGIDILNYGDERWVVDGRDLPNPGTNDQMVIALYGANEHWKGFKVVNTDSINGPVTIGNPGHDNWVEDFIVTDNPTCDGAVDISNSYGNLIQDAVVYAMGDGVSVNTNVPDCFRAQSGAHDNLFVRCIGFNGPDDCLDTYTAGINNNAIDCVMVAPGWYWNGNPGSQDGDGKGFKMGGAATSGRNKVYGSLVYKAFGHALSANNAGLGGVEFHHCTAVDGNDYGYYMYAGTSSYHNLVRDSIERGCVNDYYGGAYNDHDHNTFDIPIAAPAFADEAGFDFSLDAGNPCIGADSVGGNLGASDVALLLAKKWMNDPNIVWHNPA